MRQIIFFDCLVRALFAFSVGASAAKLTEQQVKDTCGEKLQSVSYSDATLSP